MATFNIKVRTAGNNPARVTIVRKIPNYEGTDIDDAIANAKLDEEYKMLATLRGMIWEEDI